MPFVMSRPSFVDESLFGDNHAVAKARLARTRGESSSRLDGGIVADSDLQRIKFSATMGPPPVDMRAQRAEALRAMSQARTAKWPNTIEATRRKKEGARAERLAAEEALRVAIDKEEETFNAEKRRLAIERANKLLYDQTDRVKALHTCIHMADIESTRRDQIAFKARMKEREAAREALWVEQQKDMLRKMDAEDYARRMEERRLREAQVALKHAEYADKLATIKKEGELMREKAAEDLRVEREMEAARMATEKAAREESMRLNDYLKELKKEQAEAERLEDEKMRRCLTRVRQGEGSPRGPREKR